MVVHQSRTMLSAWLDCNSNCRYIITPIQDRLLRGTYNLKTMNRIQEMAFKYLQNGSKDRPRSSCCRELCNLFQQNWINHSRVYKLHCVTLGQPCNFGSEEQCDHSAHS